MASEKTVCDSNKNALLIPAVFLLLVIFTEFICILTLNSGHFVYTLDDTYIHLELARNIRSGHYGINPGEFSAPSSSIVWPFILAPFAATSFADYVPFVINTFAAFGTLFFFWKILVKSIRIDNIHAKTCLISFLLILLVLVTNTVGLVFIGMEHSLQLMFAVMILWGLISEIETGNAGPLLIFSILVAPLIRYENSAVSLAAIIYLFFRGYRKLSVCLAALLILIMGLFSLFLVHLGLPLLPTSVIEKSAVVASGGNADVIINKFLHSFREPRGLLLICGLLGTSFFAAFSKKEDAKRMLAAAISVSIFLHLLMGRYNWYHRYEIYIWSVTVLTLIYLNGDALSDYLTRNPKKKDLLKIMAVATAIAFVTCGRYIIDLASIPFASNNIYEQQYQMHRFVVDFYKKPVAVNDLGYVTYKNDYYVLDLIGLSSERVLTARGTSEDWVNICVKNTGVEFAMIYDDWFENVVPKHWLRVGELYLGRKAVVAGGNPVVFYAFNRRAYDESLQKLREFRKTLPDGVELHLNMLSAVGTGQIHYAR